MKDRSTLRRRQKRWDFFICHASEDKDEVARPLAKALTQRGYSVWYDEFSLKLGDSLHRTIERGLAKSRYGIVILSPNFFTKEWPQRELDALVGREIRSRKKIVLPIRHNIDQKTVARFSTQLADRVAIPTSKGLDIVVNAILEAVKNGGREVIKPLPEALVDSEFKATFSSKLANLVKLLETKKYRLLQVEDLVDVLIMLFKERIEKWDVPSVKFATKELFTNLYRLCEKEGFCELYVIFKDLFSYAYSQRKRLIGSMIGTFNLILFGSWVPDYDIEKGEKAAKVMLRLGIDFLEKDVTISENCLIAIDNLAGDMFEPEILSKEILLCANAFQKVSKNPELHDFVEQYVDWIRTNDQYAWDDEKYTYLTDSIKYAEFEQTKYSTNIEAFKKQCLLPIVEQNIDKQVQEFVDFLAESEFEGREDLNFHTSFTIELLARLILSYESVRPAISEEIKQKVKETSNSYVIKEFDRLIDNSNLLKKIYRGSEMITTFDELIRFLETSSDMENLGVGVTTYNFAMIDFEKRLKKEEKEILEKIAQKYGIQEGFEVTNQGIHFEMDHLVYLGNNKNNMRKLIEFLKEVNSKFKVKRFSTGITFELREIEKKSKV